MFTREKFFTDQKKSVRKEQKKKNLTSQSETDTALNKRLLIHKLLRKDEA